MPKQHREGLCCYLRINSARYRKSCMLGDVPAGQREQRQKDSNMVLRPCPVPMNLSIAHPEPRVQKAVMEAFCLPRTPGIWVETRQFYTNTPHFLKPSLWLPQQTSLKYSTVIYLELYVAAGPKAPQHRLLTKKYLKNKQTKKHRIH